MFASDYRSSLEAGILLIGGFVQVPGHLLSGTLNLLFSNSGVHGNEFDWVILPACWAFYYFLFRRLRVHTAS
jgi:hypothetical protein